MAIIRVQRIELPKSALAEDQKVNTIYFDSTATNDPINPSLEELQAMVDAFDKFFNTATAFPAVRTFLAETTMATQRSKYKLYNMSHATPRVPLLEVNGANPTPANTGIALPSEVALCLSYKSGIISGQAAGRSRGRIYLGPILTSSIVAEAANGESRPVSDFQNAAVQAGKRMQNESETAGFNWVIYSPTQRSENQGDFPGPFFASSAVVTLWCDNAFDTQRRRGLKATSRVQIDA